jgi:hypothetical protein
MMTWESACVLGGIYKNFAETGLICRYVSIICGGRELETVKS